MNDDLLVMDDETTLDELPHFVERLTQVNLLEAAALMANAGASPEGIALALEKLEPDLRASNERHVRNRWMSIHPRGGTVQ